MIEGLQDIDVYDDASGNYTQTAAVNGVVVSQISTSEHLLPGCVC